MSGRGALPVHIVRCVDCNRSTTGTRDPYDGSFRACPCGGEVKKVSSRFDRRIEKIQSDLKKVTYFKSKGPKCSV